MDKGKVYAALDVLYDTLKELGEAYPSESVIPFGQNALWQVREIVTTGIRKKEKDDVRKVGD